VVDGLFKVVNSKKEKLLRKNTFFRGCTSKKVIIFYQHPLKNQIFIKKVDKNQKVILFKEVERKTMK
jgi:hypothetical protein